MKNPESKTKDIGRFGEDAVTHYLRRRFYKISNRNYTAGKYEIDIVAETLHHIVFVEVKTRTQDPQCVLKYGKPSDAVTFSKRAYLIAAARQYLLTHKTHKAVRFDVVEVYLSEKTAKILKIKHMKDAFRAY